MRWLRFEKKWWGYRNDTKLKNISTDKKKYLLSLYINGLILSEYHSIYKWLFCMSYILHNQIFDQDEIDSEKE